jgi:iron complex outermembrane receptor protein
LQPEKGYSAELGIKQGFNLAGSWVGYADLSGFANFFTNMTEFSFGQFGPKSEWTNLSDDLGFGFSSQNIGKTRILGTELVLGSQGKIGPVHIDLMTGYTYIDPRSLNWNDPLTLYNYQGYPLSNTGNAALAYNQANNVNHIAPITYAETSTTSTNLLKYRSPHTLKFDVTATWKGFEINTNMQYASFQKNIDYAFVSPLFRLLEGTAFQGLDQWRTAKENTPIGQGRGDIDWNWRFGYSLTNGIKIAFLVKNILNWEYMARPAYFAEPRNYTLQVSYTMQPKKKKKVSQ